MPWRRVAGAPTIVLGLFVIGVEALSTMGARASPATCCSSPPDSFAIFGMLLRHFRLAPMRAAAVTSVLSLSGLPLLLLCFDNMVAAGFWENLVQVVVQGILAGAGGIYLFARAVILLGAGRAALFPALVPGFSLIIGFLALGELPSVSQLVGLVIVIAGFRFTHGLSHSGPAYLPAVCGNMF